MEYRKWMDPAHNVWNGMEMIQGISDIHILVTAAMVFVEPWDGDQISAQFYLNDPAQTVCYNMGMERSGRQVTIQFKKKPLDIFSLNLKAAAVIRVPQSSNFGWRVDSASGDICFHDLNAGGMLLKTASGSVEIHDVKAGVLQVNTASGSAELLGVDSDTIQVNLASGAVKLDVQSPDVSLHTASGSIQGRCVGRSPDTGAVIDANTASGSISLIAGGYYQKVNLKTASGSIRMVFPPQYAVQHNCRSISGKVQTRTRDTGSRTIHVTAGTASGSIHLESMGKEL